MCGAFFTHADKTTASVKRAIGFVPQNRPSSRTATRRRHSKEHYLPSAPKLALTGNEAWRKCKKCKICKIPKPDLALFRKMALAATVIDATDRASSVIPRPR